MKRVLFALIAIISCVLCLTACSNKVDSFYGEIDDYTSEKTDNDSHGNEHSGNSGLPGGGGGGTPGGSTGSSDKDNDTQDDNPETNDDSLSDDEDSNTEEISDSDQDQQEIPEKDDNNDEEEDEDDEDFSSDDIYSDIPDVGSCVSGTPTDSEKQKVLDRINYIRSIHHLEPVSYNPDDDTIAAECSLIIAANKELSHQPEKTWKCWSQEAYDGCSSSNIFIQWANYDISPTDSTTIVDSFMTDENVDTLGHRRWLIDPWLASISFGRADDYENFIIGSAIVIDNQKQNIADSDLEYVAYPFEEYPQELYNDDVMMSFSVIKDKFNKSANGMNINLSSAVIAITNPNNKTMKVKNILFDTDGYGVPNNIRWFTEEIKPNVRYNVTVSNIIVNNVSTLYQYWFELK